MEKKRSVGVTIFSVIMIIAGIVLIFATYSVPLIIESFMPTAMLSLCIIIIVGIYILKRKNWARILVLWVTSLWVIVGLLTTYSSIFKTAMPGSKLVVNIVADFLIWHFLPFVTTFYFFTRPKVREQFK